jgi:hypothetical protein
MANPFPGMDPYLEGDLWPTVHYDLTAEIARDLAPRLRPRYVVRTNRRFLYAAADPAEANGDARLPDVGVTSPAPGPGGGSGSAVAAAPLIRQAVMSDVEEQYTVEVFDAAHRRLVTAIEVLSPSNKLAAGGREYAAKRQQYLHGPAHLIEIDLLRAGARFPVREPLPPEPYFVFLSRAERRPLVEIWPVALPDPLPVVPVPLLPGDADVLLDLNHRLAAIHELFNYANDLDYIQPPPGPLTPEQAAWIDRRLRETGRRP